MRGRNPLGLYDEPSPAEGVASYAGSGIPAPLGTGSSDASSHWTAASESRPAESGAAANVSVSFVLGPDTYRLVRLDTEWRQGLDEVRVPPHRAVAIIGQATTQQHGNSDVVELFETAASRLAGLHENGVFVLLQKERFQGASAKGQAAPRTTPSALRPPSPPELPLSVEEPVMGAMQATVLKDAAAQGVPFCEECARAAAARGGTPTAA